MSEHSDLTLNGYSFRPDAVNEKDRQSLEMIRNMPHDQPWWEIGMKEFRRREEAGELLYKPRHLHHRAELFVVPSREAGRPVLCRVFRPPADREIKGVLLHIHGGGWTVFDNKFSDVYLSQIADGANLITISVEYRLAPEHPFPKGLEDCFDVAEYLVANSKAKLGAEFGFIDGSSSGAHFAALTALHLRNSHPEFHLQGLVLKYGIFDLTYTNPSIVNTKDPIIVTHDALKHTTEAFIPNTTLQDRQNPDVSPIYADLQTLSPLPSALFVCGTQDILMDDSIFFSAKWMMVNSKTVLKMFPGALHGFVDFEGMPMLQEGYDTIIDFLVRT